MGMFDWLKGFLSGPQPRFSSKEEYDAFRNRADKEIKEVLKQIPDTYLQEIPGTNWNTLEKSAREYSSSLSRLLDILSKIQKDKPKDAIESNLCTMAHNHLGVLKKSHALIQSNIEAYEKNYIEPLRARLQKLSSLLQNEQTKFKGVKAIDEEQLHSLESMQQSLAEMEKDFRDMYKGLSYGPIAFTQLLGESPESTKNRIHNFLSSTNVNMLSSLRVSLEKIDKLILSEVKSIKSLYSRFRNRLIALEKLEQRKAA